jgi:hypothetical protein
MLQVKTGTVECISMRVVSVSYCPPKLYAYIYYHHTAGSIILDFYIFLDIE